MFEIIIGIVLTLWFFWSVLYWRIEVEDCKLKIKTANAEFQELLNITGEWSRFATDESQIDKYESLKNLLLHYRLVEVTKDFPVWQAIILKSWILIANILCLIALGLILGKMAS